MYKGMVKLRQLANRINPPRIGVGISGGGCKAFYGLGFFSRLQELGLKAKVWGGASAGASMALSLALRRVEEVMKIFTALTEVNEKNMYISRLVQGKRPFPHEAMYRTTVRKGLDWDRFQKEVEEIYIPVAKVPENKLVHLHENIKVFYDLSKAYRQDMELKEKGEPERYLHRIAKKVGLEEFVFRKKDIRDPAHLEDIILASSSLPPLVRFQQIDGQRYLDGGIFNNLPLNYMQDVDYRLGVVYEENDLVNYHKLLKDDRTIIFFPLKKVDIAIWEYSRPDLIEETFEHGRRDGDRAAEKIPFLLH